MVNKPRSSKSLSEDEFNAQLRAERTPKPVSHGMVMTRPPSGPSRSLEDVLREHELDGHVTAKTEEASERKYRKIDISLIDPNPLAPREIYTAEMVRDRANALLTQGQHDPIHVIPNPDEPGRFIICDGWTRVQACRDHQVMRELLAEVHEDMSLEESAWFGYQQNEEREQHCDLDRAMFYEKLIGAGESATEVARKAGLSKQHMTSFRAYSKLPVDVLEIVRSDPKRFGANAAYQILKVYERVGVKQAVRLAAQFAEESRTYSWLVSQVHALAEPRHARNATASRQIRYTNGFYKQKGDAFEVSIVVSPEKRAKFALELESLLSSVAEEVVAPTGEAEHGSERAE